MNCSVDESRSQGRCTRVQVMRITPEDKQEELMELPVGNHVFGGVAAKSSACDSQEVDLTRKLSLIHI